MKFLKQNWKKYIIGILIGIVVFPTITLGGSFVSSLIQGKTVDEAVQILAEQMDILIGRVEKVETKQGEQEEVISGQQDIIEQQQELIQQLQQGEQQLRACTRWTDYVKAKEDIEYYQENDLIDSNLNIIDPKPNGSPNTLDREKFEETKLNYQKYQELKATCES